MNRCSFFGIKYIKKLLWEVMISFFYIDNRTDSLKLDVANLAGRKKISI